MGNFNTVTITNESKFELKGELFSHNVQVPLTLPYKQPVQFKVGTFKERNVIRLNHNNGELFGITHFHAVSGD